MKHSLITKNIVFAFIVLNFMSCDKDDELTLSELSGIYNGTFSVEYSEDPIFYDQLELSNGVTIEFENGNFTCSSGENHVPAGGSGKYEINGNKITFDDENGWYADFDGNLILDGEYDIKETKSEITISAHKGIGFYKYRLIRK